MKAIALHGYGGSEGFKFEDVDQPQPDPNEVLISVSASAVDPGNVKRAAGKMRAFTPELEFPWIPGAAVSGVVAGLGAGVTGFSVGDEVFGYRAIGGAYAEFVAIEANAISHKPANISHAEAAAIAVSGQTALLALEAAELQPGQTILILGAAGSVGSAAVQLAQARGANVIAVCRGRSLARMRELQLTTLIDSDTSPFESIAQAVDVVLDTLGGEFEAKGMSVLKPQGVLVALVQPPSQEEAARRGVRAVLVRTESSTSNLMALRQPIEAGILTPFIGQAYPFTEAAQAWENYTTRRIEGKIVIDFQA